MNKKIIILILFVFALIPFLSTNAISSPNSIDVAPVNEVKKEFKLRKEIIKFIPYKELNKLLSANKRLVYMSYRELKKLIQEKSKPAPPAPVDYVIKDLKLKGIIKTSKINNVTRRALIVFFFITFLR